MTNNISLPKVSARFVLGVTLALAAIMALSAPLLTHAATLLVNYSLVCQEQTSLISKDF